MCFYKFNPSPRPNLFINYFMNFPVFPVFPAFPALPALPALPAFSAFLFFPARLPTFLGICARSARAKYDANTTQIRP